VPAPTPTRDRNVFMVGAGLSCALGLPNTAMLLDGVFELSERFARWQRDRLVERLERAFEFFYPEAVHEGYSLTSLISSLLCGRG
jgi:NAD-dependent SIR2 family protein deacetylase